MVSDHQFTPSNLERKGCPTLTQNKIVFLVSLFIYTNQQINRNETFGEIKIYS